MNIGIRLHDVVGDGLEAKLQEAHALGFTCVHIALSKVIDGFTMADAPSLLTEELAAHVKGLLDKYSLQPAVLGCYLNLATPDKAELEMATAAYAAHLCFAAQIGAKVVGTETGAPNTGYKTTQECFTEEALQLFIARLRPVVHAAELVGIPIAIEPVCRHIVNTPARARQVLDAIDSDMCRIILDSVNLLDAGNAKGQEALFDEALRLLGSAIEVVHWKDYRMEQGALVAVAAGHGELHAGNVTAWLKARPGMPVTLENTSAETVVAARASLIAQLT